METYWTALSGTYQMKVRKIAREHSVNTHTVMRNLEGHLKDEIKKAYQSHNGFISMRELEALIDNISNGRKNNTGRDCRWDQKAM